MSCHFLYFQKLIFIYHLFYSFIQIFYNLLFLLFYYFFKPISISSLNILEFKVFSLYMYIQNKQVNQKKTSFIKNELSDLLQILR